MSRGANEQPAGGVMTQGAVIAMNADGSEKGRHTFEGERVAPPFSRMTNPLELIAGEGLLAATSDSVTTDKLTIRSGRLRWFDPYGDEFHRRVGLAQVLVERERQAAEPLGPT